MRDQENYGQARDKVNRLGGENKNRVRIKRN